MRRLLILIALLLISCSGFFPLLRQAAGQPVVGTTAAGTLAALPTTSAPISTATSAELSPRAPAATTTPAAAPTATPTAAATPTLVWLEAPADQKRKAFEVRFQPAGELYVGDQVSIEVLPPAGPPDGFQTDGRDVRVNMDGPAGPEIGQAGFSPFGLGGRIQATMQWVWDTAALPAGEQTLFFTVHPNGPAWSETVALLPRGQLPADERQSRWAHAESDCCLVYYITNTAAERDLAELLRTLDEQSEQASQRMGAALSEPVEVTLLPRVAGHGGFAGEGLTLSYLDRDYAGADKAVVFHHELIHILDARLGGHLRPPVLGEGVAVYQSGGHFKLEPLLVRAAALLPPEPGCIPLAETADGAGSPGPGQEACGLGLYIPLTLLADRFYEQKHEIGYLQAGALVAYMVESWGWKSFSAFYRDILPVERRPEDGGERSDALAIDQALQRHFGISLAELEEDFEEALRQEQLTPEWVQDLRLSLTLYDRVRAYQQTYDPSAYFLYAWLPESEQMRMRGIVADYLRSPSQPENLALETMLIAADADLRAGSYPEADRLLRAISSVLAQGAEAGFKAFHSDPLAEDYYALVLEVQSQGYLPQRIQVGEDTARVWASLSGAQVVEISYLRTGGGWAPLKAVG
jgi:hypothetical protein